MGYRHEFTFPRAEHPRWRTRNPRCAGNAATNPQIYQRNQQDRIGRRVNPTLMLTPHDMNAIRTMYPNSIGVRILIAGWAVLLFTSKDEMIAGWRQGIPDTIGDLYVGQDINEATSTTATTRAGYAVSGARESFDSLGALGLRLKMRNRLEAITTVL